MENNQKTQILIEILDDCRAKVTIVEPNGKDESFERNYGSKKILERKVDSLKAEMEKEGAEVTVINEASQNTNAPEINGNDASIDPSESQLLNPAAEIEQTPDTNLNDGEYDFGFEEF